jgi:hypothetical protein
MKIGVKPSLLAAAVRGDIRYGNALYIINRYVYTIVQPGLQPPTRKAPKPLISIEPKRLDIVSNPTQLKLSVCIPNHQGRTLRESQQTSTCAPGHMDMPEPTESKDFRTYVLIFQYDRDTRVRPVRDGSSDRERASRIRRSRFAREVVGQDVYRNHLTSAN